MDTKHFVFGKGGEEDENGIVQFPNNVEVAIGQTDALELLNTLRKQLKNCIDGNQQNIYFNLIGSLEEGPILPKNKPTVN